MGSERLVIVLGRSPYTGYRFPSEEKSRLTSPRGRLEYWDVLGVLLDTDKDPRVYVAATRELFDV